MRRGFAAGGFNGGAAEKGRGDHRHGRIERSDRQQPEDERTRREREQNRDQQEEPGAVREAHGEENEVQPAHDSDRDELLAERDHGREVRWSYCSCFGLRSAE